MINPSPLHFRKGVSALHQYKVSLVAQVSGHCFWKNCILQVRLINFAVLFASDICRGILWGDIWEEYRVQTFPACLPCLLEQTALLHFPSVFYKVKVNIVITLFTLISCSVPAKQQIGSQQSRSGQN